MSEFGISSPDTSWGSHLVPLMACVCATRGAVLEAGVGDWSTPLLHAYCAAGGRKLVSIDENRTWVQKFTNLRVCGHEVYGAEYRTEIPLLAQREWSVAFLDHSPGWRRAEDALLFRDTADLILVHDYSGAEVMDSFAPILDRWPHRAVAKFSPSTLVLGRVPIPQFEKREMLLRGSLDPQSEDYVGHIAALEAGVSCSCSTSPLHCPHHGR